METLLTVAKKAARDAGEFIMTQYGNTESTLKSDKSPVTEADMGSNTRIMEALEKTNIPVLSEEILDRSHITSPYPEKLWIIDPLDGTRDFIEGGSDFSVMIGLLINGRPALGVVYAPKENILYYAYKNHGAFMEKDGVITPLQVSDRKSPELHLIRSRHHYTPFMESVAHKLSIAHAAPHGSVGIKAGLLGTQHGDLFFYTGPLGIWDVCGPEIIVEEAGGTVTDIHGNYISYTETDYRISKGAIFSNRACHSDALQAIKTTLIEIPIP